MSTYIAPSPVSPVRIRITCSTAEMKILPSPTEPVLASDWIASTIFLTLLKPTPIPLKEIYPYEGEKISQIFLNKTPF